MKSPIFDLKNAEPLINFIINHYTMDKHRYSLQVLRIIIVCIVMAQAVIILIPNSSILRARYHKIATRNMKLLLGEVETYWFGYIPAFLSLFIFFIFTNYSKYIYIGMVGILLTNLVSFNIYGIIFAQSKV